jgi:hypothetical protein
LVTAPAAPADSAPAALLGALLSVPCREHGMHRLPSIFKP